MITEPCAMRVADQSVHPAETVLVVLVREVPAECLVEQLTDGSQIGRAQRRGVGGSDLSASQCSHGTPQSCRPSLAATSHSF